jgi:hypothetical protein
MSSALSKILDQYGPMLSGQAGRLLRNATGISEIAVRQRISRTSSPIHKLNGINFAKNQKFLYLSSQFQKPLFKEKLIGAFSNGAVCYANAIRCLESKGGRMPHSSWLTSCGSPIRKLKGHLLAETILAKLNELNIVEIAPDDRYGRIIRLSSVSTARQKLWALCLAETMVLKMVSDWARKLALTSYEQQNIRSFDEPPPEFGGFGWDYSAPCFLNGIVRYDETTSKTIPGFFVADICLNQSVTYDDLVPFFTKLNIVRNRTGVRPFVPCFIASDLDSSAIKALRQHKVLVGLLSNIFDKDTKDLLATLINTLEHATSFAANHPERIESLLEGLSRIEGEALNVRGALFTMIVGHYCSAQGARIEINKEVYDPESEARGDIDVLVDHDSAHVSCIECKGKHSNARVTLPEAQKWISSKIPLMRKFLHSHEQYAHKHMSFELWTSGRFEQDAIDFLRAREEHTAKYKIAHRDRDSILRLFQEAKLNKLARMLIDHYDRRST